MTEKYVIDDAFETQNLINLMDARNEIVDNLWIGQCPREPHEGIGDFKYVINLLGRNYYVVRNFQTVITAPFDDSPRLPDEDFLNDLAVMASEFAYKGKTLVHCMAGVNRSAMIVALALVHRGFTGKEAVDLVRKKRGSALLCNETFAEYVLSKGR